MERPFFGVPCMANNMTVQVRMGVCSYRPLANSKGVHREVESAP